MKFLFYLFDAKKQRKSWILLPYLWYVIFLIAPLFTILAISFSEYQLAAPPYKPLIQWIDREVLQLQLSFSNYLIIFRDNFYKTAFINSIKIAFFSTLFCLMIGYPMAYGIARSRKKMLWLMLAILPFGTSFLVRVYAWINLLSPLGLVNHGLSYFHLGPFALINNPYAVIIGIVYSYLPFMIFPIYAVLDKMDPHLIEAAYDLGCRRFSAFWRITVPLSFSGIVTGASLVFIPAVGEYIIPEFLGGSCVSAMTIGRLLWAEFFINRDWPVASALAIIMIILLLIPILIFEKLQNVIETQEG
jgi:putrescine transport system permease protein